MAHLTKFTRNNRWQGRSPIKRHSPFSQIVNGFCCINWAICRKYWHGIGWSLLIWLLLAQTDSRSPWQMMKRFVHNSNFDNVHPYICNFFKHYINAILGEEGWRLKWHVSSWFLQYIFYLNAPAANRGLECLLWGLKLLCKFSKKLIFLLALKN